MRGWENHPTLSTVYREIGFREGQGQGQAWQLSEAWGTLAASVALARNPRSGGTHHLQWRKRGIKLAILRATDELAGSYMSMDLGNPMAGPPPRPSRVPIPSPLLCASHLGGATCQLAWDRAGLQTPGFQGENQTHPPQTGKCHPLPLACLRCERLCVAQAG